MSRTTLCVITAAALAVLSVGTMAARWCLLGDEVRRPDRVRQRDEVPQVPQFKTLRHAGILPGKPNRFRL